MDFLSGLLGGGGGGAGAPKSASSSTSGISYGNVSAGAASWELLAVIGGVAVLAVVVLMLLKKL